MMKATSAQLIYSRPVFPRSIVFSSPLVFTLCLALRTCAQDAVGSLEGHVFDTSGAVIRSATISLTDLATNAKRTRNPDNDGLYRSVELGVSSYSLSVDAAGFAHFSQAPIEITISQTSRVDVSLAVGSTTQSVSISDAPAAIDTSTNTLGKVVDSRELLDLRLNGPNFAQLGLPQ